MTPESLRSLQARVREATICFMFAMAWAIALYPLLN